MPQEIRSIKEDIPEIEDQIRKGQFVDLLEWLVSNIHQHGKRCKPQELVQRMTDSKIDAAPYLRYLKNKYSDIYGF
jgi:carboxypeptidase Taq